jgi:energy-coupling factor transport system ATP-binding protein
MDAIRIEDLSWIYAGTTEPAIEHINLSIRVGETVLITGPAGAGKSTLLYTLNGIIPHFIEGYLKGRVVINEDIDVRAEEISTLSNIIGLVLQDYSEQLIMPTVIDDVAYALENFGVEPAEIERRVRKAINTVGLKGFEQRHPHSLSGGEQQLCALASILALDPPIYVLDEPVSALDPIGRETVGKILKSIISERKKTIIIVEQNLEEFIEWVDRLVVLYDGKIILEGDPKELLSSEENIRLLMDKGVNVPDMTIFMNRIRGLTGDSDIDPVDIDLGRQLLKLLDLIESGLLKRPREFKRNYSIGQDGVEPIIVTENLTHVYPGNIVALRDVSIKIYPGEFVAIVGQNGSGKTTLLKHFNGLLRPTRGKVFVDGLDTSKFDVSRLSQIVGLVFQHPRHQLFKFKVVDELIMSMKRLKIEKEEKDKRAREILKVVNLEHVADEYVHNLSLGERKRLTLAVVLAMDPKIILVDEPTTGQDLNMRLEIMELLYKLNKEGKTIIVVTHDMSLVAKYIDRVLVMGNGKILADGYTLNIFRNRDVLGMTRLKSPPIPELFHNLEMKLGIPLEVLTIDEGVSLFE